MTLIRKSLLLIALLALAMSASAQSQTSNTVNFQGIVPPPAPTIGVLTPASGYVGAAANIVFTGTNLAPTCTATFNGVAVPFTFVSATSGSIAVPAGKVATGNNPIIVSCANPVLTMNSPVQLPNGSVGQPYTVDLASVTALQKNGAPCSTCSFSSSNLPTSLTLSASGVVTGTFPGAGSSFDFTVTDALVSGRNAVTQWAFFTPLKRVHGR